MPASFINNFTISPMSKRIENNRYTADFFILRTPRKPINQIDSLFNEYKKLNSIESKNEFLSKFLVNYFNSEDIKEALYLSSPSVYYTFQKFNSEKSLSQNESKKLLLTLLRFLIRFSTRCTPFGLFAGCTIGEITSNTTELKLDAFNSLDRHTRIDMGYLSELVQKIGSTNEVIRKLRYKKNSSIYRVGNKYRYVISKISNSKRSYYLTSCIASYELVSILNFTKKWISFSDLESFIVKNGISNEEASAFILDLINSQLIISEIEPNVIGNEFQTNLISKLKELAENNSEIQNYYIALSNVNKELKQLDSKECDDKIIKYNNAYNLLKEIDSSVKEDRLFQTDYFQPSINCQIDNIKISKLNTLIENLGSIIPFNIQETLLEKFKIIFRERFETEEVPLTIALDPEIGIGYNKTSLFNLSKNKTSNIDNELFTQYRFDKFKEAIRLNLKEIQLNDIELDKLKYYKNKLPNTICAKIGLTKGDNGEEIIIFNGVHGPGAMNMLGRFCHINSALNDKVVSYLQTESLLHNSSIFAEISHLPQGRLGNILIRPHLTEYEINYLSNSSKTDNYEINVEDLFLSIKDNRLILRSHKLNSEIIPKLTSAHNYFTNNLPIYHFLCDLQSQSYQTYLNWQWGTLNQESYLPRVCYKDFILSPAFWNIPSSKILDIKSANPNELLNNFDQFKEKYKLPRRILIVENDNKLLLDFEVLDCLLILISIAAKYKTVTFEEFLFNDKNSLVTSQIGNYTNEILIPMISNSGISSQISLLKSNIINVKKVTKRLFPPGSEWIYFKIYTGPKTSDEILIRTISKLYKKMLKEKLIDNWFFIRYSDPNFHLRIRFHLSDINHFQIVSQLINHYLKKYLKSKEIWDISMSTYKREIERYGTNSIEVSEAIFQIQSEEVIELIKLFKEDSLQYYYFAITCCSIDNFLNCFNYSITEKLDILNKLKESFSIEFRLSQDLGLRETLKNISRDNKTIVSLFIDEIYNEKKESNSFIKSTQKILHKNNYLLENLCDKIRSLENVNQQNSLIGSYTHMYINRLFRENQRKNELIVYDLLVKFYNSKIAKTKYSN